MVSDRQVVKLRKYMAQGLTQEAAASKAGMSKRNGLETLMEMRPLTEGSTTCRQPVQCDGEALFNTAQTRSGAVMPLVHDWTHARRSLDPWRYLRDVFAAIAEGISGPALARDFTPWAWSENQAQKAKAEEVAAVA